jgi:hypothetical protein
MADKMPPELLEKFKKMGDKKEGKESEKTSDKDDTRKRALAKARKAKQMAKK